MKILMMGDNSYYHESLNIHSFMKNRLEYPHQYLKYSIIIDWNSQYFNIKTGKYTDIETTLKKYQKKFNFNK